MMNFWPLYFDKPLIYIGDAYDRVNVVPVTEIGNINHLKIDRRTMQQFFRWPDGIERAVPSHCVVIDTQEVRIEKGLDCGLHVNDRQC